MILMPHCKRCKRRAHPCWISSRVLRRRDVLSSSIQKARMAYYWNCSKNTHNLPCHTFEGATGGIAVHSTLKSMSGGCLNTSIHIECSDAIKTRFILLSIMKDIARYYYVVAVDETILAGSGPSHWL